MNVTASCYFSGLFFEFPASFILFLQTRKSWEVADNRTGYGMFSLRFDELWLISLNHNENIMNCDSLLNHKENIPYPLWKCPRYRSPQPNIVRVCDLSRWTPRQREFHSKSLYCDKFDNGALLYFAAINVAVPYNVRNRKLTSISTCTFKNSQYIFAITLLRF